MNNIKFSGKIRKDGTSWVVTVPSQYVSNGILTLETEYTFEVTEKGE